MTMWLTHSRRLEVVPHKILPDVIIAVEDVVKSRLRLFLERAQGRILLTVPLETPLRRTRVQHAEFRQESESKLPHVCVLRCRNRQLI
jgi:hypothetical protein